MAPQIVLSTRVPWDGPENLPSQRSMSKAPIIVIRWPRVKWLRNSSSTIPIDPQYFSHLDYARGWSACFFPVTATSRAVSAAAISAKRIFLWTAVLYRNDLESAKEWRNKKCLLFHRRFCHLPERGRLIHHSSSQGTTGYNFWFYFPLFSLRRFWRPRAWRWLVWQSSKWKIAYVPLDPIADYINMLN